MPTFDARQPSGLAGGAAGSGVQLRGITKRFGPVLANDGVNLRVERGTIHGVIGENGAGKSTAMKILYGLCRPDAGELIVEGKECVWGSPADAIARGIGMVHQHFMLAGPYSGLDNILLGAEAAPAWRPIDRRRVRARLEALARQYGLPVDWDRPVEELPIGIQQRIEILKLLYREAGILILDEPTAVLTPRETNELFGNLKKLRDEGKTILFVTHKLREVMAFTERLTVFRAGKVVGDALTANTGPQELANLMVGRKVVLNVEASPSQPGSEIVLQVADLTLRGSGRSRPRLDRVSFSLRKGEIVGIAGVEGNGQSELIEAMLHPHDARGRTSGTISFLGEDVTAWPAAKIRDLGVAVIPEDRARQGLLPERPLSENFLLGLQWNPAFARGGFLDRLAVGRSAAQAIEQFDVRPADLTMPAARLSGGNQQKLIVAREFHRKTRVLVAAQPTRGVDVGSMEFIHRRIIRARDEGAGVLLISSELDEILALADRILVMYEGRIVAEFRRGQVSEGELGLRMGGA